MSGAPRRLGRPVAAPKAAARMGPVTPALNANNRPLFLLLLSQPHARTVTLLVDELDACPPQSQVNFSPCLVKTALGIP